MARLRSVSVAQAKPPKATESRHGWAAALLRGRAPGVTLYRVGLRDYGVAARPASALAGLLRFREVGASGFRSALSRFNEHGSRATRLIRRSVVAQ